MSMGKWDWKYKREVVLRRAILVETVMVAVLAGILLLRPSPATVAVKSAKASASGNSASGSSDYIKWVDFTVSYEALCEAYAWDVDTHGTAHEIDWIDLLAYTAAQTGGEFGKKAMSILSKTAKELSEGSTTMEELTKDMKYYTYYREAYSAVLGGLVGEYEAETEDENGQKSFRLKYGLKAYFPLARGFDYSHYDDFGAGRNYGYKRKHLGHDMMGLVGTPTGIICRIKA